MLISLDYLAQALVSMSVGTILLLRGQQDHHHTSTLWGWGWIFLGASQTLAGALLYLIQFGAAESGLRSAASLLSTISVLCAATFLSLGLYSLQRGRVFRARELVGVIVGLSAIAIVSTAATAPLAPEYRLFWRVGLFRSGLVGFAFVALGVASLGASDSGARLKHRALFGGAAFVWGAYLVAYFVVTGWNLYISPLNVSYRAPMQPMEGGLLALLAIGMIAWVSGDEEQKRRRAERDLIEVQKHEFLGMLAGGIAHEFNNQSQVITLAAESARLAAVRGDPDGQAQSIDVILDCCSRVGDMTSALLDYSGPAQPSDSRVIASDLGAVLRLNMHMLSFVLPANIELAVDGADTEVMVPVAETDLKKVILNLCMNARDAMPDGGRLRVSLLLEESGPRPVMLRVVDSGSGISDSVRDSIFEPFFSTKRLGEGTGLGLSSVLGIVTAAGGTVEVQSEPGLETTFTVLLPLASA